MTDTVEYVTKRGTKQTKQVVELKIIPLFRWVEHHSQKPSDIKHSSVTSDRHANIYHICFVTKNPLHTHTHVQAGTDQDVKVVVFRLMHGG